MKRVLIVVGAPAALIVLMLLVGSLLPAGHVASRSARYSQPRTRVFDVVSDFAGGARWRGDVSAVEVLAPDEQGRPLYREVGGHGPVTYRVLESVPPARFASQIADTDAGYSGGWTLELTEEDAGTRLAITEEGEVTNPILRFLGLFVSKTASMDAYLVDLGRELGEDVTPE